MMKLFLVLLVLTSSAFGQVRLSDKGFKTAVLDCGGYLHPAEATDIEAAQVKSCVEKKLKERKQFDDLKETVEFWRPLMTMKDNEARARCRHHIGKRDFHGEDSGEYEACIKKEDCVNPTPWVDHVGLSEAPCVSRNSLGISPDKNVVSGDRTGAADKKVKIEAQESQKKNGSVDKK